MELDAKTQEKIRTLQGYEQTIQSLVMQKQAFHMELTEAENALIEIKKSGDDIFKMIGKIMVKADKKNVTEELEKKKDLISLRLKSIEKQEADTVKQAEELRNEVMGTLK